jgi:hypothetical protein
VGLLTAAIVSVGCGDSAPATPPMTIAGSPGSSGTAPAGTGGAAGAAAGMTSAAGGGTTSVSGSGGQSEGGSAAAGMAGMAGAAPIMEGLSVSPLELVFGAVQQTDAPTQLVTLKNVGSSPLELSAVSLDAAAPGTASFELMASPPAGTELGAGQQLEVSSNRHRAVREQHRD